MDITRGMNGADFAGGANRSAQLQRMRAVHGLPAVFARAGRVRPRALLGTCVARSGPLCIPLARVERGSAAAEKITLRSTSWPRTILASERRRLRRPASTVAIVPAITPRKPTVASEAVRLPEKIRTVSPVSGTPAVRHAGRRRRRLRRIYCAPRTRGPLLWTTM